LRKSYVRQYSALSEYGGWGLRYGIFGNGTAFNISGNKGLKLEFSNNKKYSSEPISPMNWSRS